MFRLRSDRSALENGFALVVTTNDSERKAILSRLDPYRKLEPDFEGTRAYLGIVEDRLVVVLDAAGGFARDDTATRVAIRFLANPMNPTPALVAICGVCWGNPATTKKGQVLLATGIVSINRGTFKVGGQVSQPYSYISSIKLPDGVVGDNTEYGATVLTLEQNIQDPSRRDELLRAFPHVSGGEMEAFAVIPELVSKRIPWLVVKGVSDFGEHEFDRTGQPEAAQRAAHQLTRVIEVNIDRSVASSMESPERRFRIIQEMRGSEMLIEKKDLDQNNIKVDIQRKLQQLQAGIAFYTGAALVSAKLPRGLSLLLLEVALNCLTHGRATRVHLAMFLDRIILKADGRLYDASSLTNEADGQGGQLTWQTFFRDFGERVTFANVEPKDTKKWTHQYEFCMSGISEKLHDSRTRCSVHINIDKYAVMTGQSVFTTNPACELVHVDLSPIDMMSVALDVARSFGELLREGKKIVVFTPNRDLAERINRNLSDDVASGRITIMSNY